MKCVETHNEKRDKLPDLIQKMHSMDTLVLYERSKALGIISKFEPKKYVHPLVDADGNNLRFYLPRYGLTFAVSNGILHCKELKGHRLGPNQQIAGTLRGFEMYLLLEKSSGDEKIIIFPKGNVVRKSTGRVHIELQDDCDEKILWYRYRFHPRFHYIEARQVCPCI